MIKGVIFDVDGTLIDSVDLHAAAWQEALHHYGHDVPYDDVRGQIGKGGDQIMPVFLSDEELQRFGEELDHYRHDMFTRDFMGMIRPFPAVRDLMERLRRDGRHIALATSAKGDKVETYKKIADIEDVVGTETSSDDADRSKPYPDVFLAALDRLGLPPDEAVVVGDTPYDAEAARRGGMAVIGLLRGGFAENDLRAAGCAEIYRDPQDLLRNYGRSLIARSQ